jgi:Fungal specific transcription factor domain
MTALFKNQDEYQYWLYFRDDISHDLSGHAPTKCWNYVVLQACNDSPALRHLTVALAALSKSKHSFASTASHRQFAFNKYGQALRSIQEMISSRNDPETIRTMLIASLLIFSFESMDGNAEQAIKHAKASLNVMRKRFDTSRRKYSQIRRLSSIPGFEDEVLEVFVRLDLTIMSGIQGNPYHERQSSLDIVFIDEHLYMPPSFRDLVEAKGYLEHFQFRAMPYLSHMTDIFMYGDKYACPVPESAYELLQSQLQQWYTSFKPMFDRACRPGDKDFVGAAMLRCLALGTDISVQRVCMKVHTRPAKLFEAEAREIVDLSRRVVRDHRFKNAFGFDCGIIPSLFIAIMICRNREIRKEAIEILRMAEGRVEVVWDASKVAELGEQMLNAEERGETILSFEKVLR